MIGCQTFMAVTIDACAQAGPVTSVTEVQTEDTVELLESVSKPTCSSTAEVQTTFICLRAIHMVFCKALVHSIISGTIPSLAQKLVQYVGRYGGPRG